MGSKSQQQVQVTPSASAAILVVMYIAAFVAAFNENIINVALHDIMAAFSVSATTAQSLRRLAFCCQVVFCRLRDRASCSRS